MIYWLRKTKLSILIIELILFQTFIHGFRIITNASKFHIETGWHLERMHTFKVTKVGLYTSLNCAKMNKGVVENVSFVHHLAGYLLRGIISVSDLYEI